MHNIGNLKAIPKPSKGHLKAISVQLWPLHGFQMAFRIQVTCFLGVFLRFHYDVTYVKPSQTGKCLSTNPSFKVANYLHFLYVNPTILVLFPYA